MKLLRQFFVRHLPAFVRPSRNTAAAVRVITVPAPRVSPVQPQGRPPAAHAVPIGLADEASPIAERPARRSYRTRQEAA